MVALRTGVTMPKFYFEDFTEGEVTESPTRRITREEIITYAAEFDPQPMHLDEEAARASMLGGLAASGWHSCAIMMRMLCDWFVLDSASMGAPGVDEACWLNPLRPDDVIKIRRTVREKRASRSRPDRGFVSMHYEMINQNGEVVMTLTTPMMAQRRDSASQSESTAAAS
jgi:acyl dehydratase